MRLILHNNAQVTENNNKAGLDLQSLECEDLSGPRAFVEKLLEDSLVKLEQEDASSDEFVRWELGACWIQHLQDQKNAEKEKKPSGEKTKNELKVEGLGTPLRSLKNKKKSDKAQIESSKSPSDSVTQEAESASSSSLESQHETSAKDNEVALKNLLSDAAFARLKESETGLHCKVLYL